LALAGKFALVNGLCFLCYSQRYVEHQATTSAWLESPSGQQTSVRGTCFLGRSATSDIVLPDDKVSRRHAMVHVQGRDEFWLMDLGSSNGTYLNGRRLSQPSRLVDRDVIKIGDHSFVFRNPKADAGSATSSAGAEKTVQEIKSLNCWLLLVDIEASTQFIKQLPAEEVPHMTGRWLANCKQIIDESHGTINKFLGDGFLAYWVDGEKAASVAQALGALKALQEETEPRFRIVLHYGKVFVGGAATLGEESLLGNEVNFAFRMEKLAGSVGTLRLVSEPACRHLNSLLSTTEEGRHAVPSFDGDFLFYSF
jgi:adenylate cyclase